MNGPSSSVNDARKGIYQVQALELFCFHRRKVTRPGPCPQSQCFRGCSQVVRQRSAKPPSPHGRSSVQPRSPSPIHGGCSSIGQSTGLWIQRLRDRPPSVTPIFGLVAQLVERRLDMAKIARSSRAGPSNNCSGGWNGRHDGLKIHWGQPRASSSLALSTIRTVGPVG